MLWWCQQNYPFFSDTRTAGSKQGGQSVLDGIFLCDPVNMPGSILRKYWIAFNSGGVTKNRKNCGSEDVFNKSDETVRKGAGEIQYRAVFLEASRFLNPSVPC